MGDQNETQSTTPAPASSEDTQAHITEMQRTHREAVRAHTARISELEQQVRDLATVAELLNADENDDPVILLRTLIQDRDGLRVENAELLRDTITAQVAEHVAVEAARPIIESMVANEKPARRKDVEIAVQRIVQRDDVKAMLRTQVTKESGPAQTRPVTPSQPADQPDPTETLIFIPEV